VQSGAIWWYTVIKNWDWKSTFPVSVLNAGRSSSPFLPYGYHGQARREPQRGPRKHSRGAPKTLSRAPAERKIWVFLCKMVHSGIFYISKRRRGSPNVAGPGVALPLYPTLSTGLTMAHDSLVGSRPSNSGGVSDAVCVCPSVVCLYPIPTVALNCSWRACRLLACLPVCLFTQRTIE